MCREFSILRKAVEHVNRLKPAFVVFLGDLVHAFPTKQAKEQERQVADFKSAVDEISDTIPVIFVSGNHDIGDTMTNDALHLYRDRFGPDYFQFTTRGIQGIVLNTQAFHDDSDCARRLAKQQLAFLKQALGLAPDGSKAAGDRGDKGAGQGQEKGKQSDKQEGKPQDQQQARQSEAGQSEARQSEAGQSEAKLQAGEQETKRSKTKEQGQGTAVAAEQALPAQTEKTKQHTEPKSPIRGKGTATSKGALAHRIIFGHIPPFLFDKDEPLGYFNLDPSVRLTLLGIAQEGGVSLWMSGHYHRTAGGRAGCVECVTTSAAGTVLHPSGVDPLGLKGFDGFACGEAHSGIRIVKVYQDRIEHNWYTLDSVPHAVTL